MNTENLLQDIRNFFEASDMLEVLKAFKLLESHLDIPQSLEKPLDRFRYVYEHSRGIHHRFDSLLDILQIKSQNAEYAKSRQIKDRRVLIVGAGPGGLRTAIELALLGCDSVTIVEKRTSFTRNNVLHLWPFSVKDIKSLGGKILYGKFGVGCLDHIAIRRVQIVFLKIVLLLGVNVLIRGFEYVKKAKGSNLFQMSNDFDENPYLFNILVGCDGQNTVVGKRFAFERKTLNFGCAIGISANFVKSETVSEEPQGIVGGRVSYLNRPFFKRLNDKHGIELENLVYYKDETHYTVMTAKKSSLLRWGILKQDENDTEKLLKPSNVDMDKLKQYVRCAANELGIPSNCAFADFGGRSDVAIFDFSSSSAAIYPSKFHIDGSSVLFVSLVGDSLILPFWPLGTGLAHACLSALDLGWVVSHMGHPTEWKENIDSILANHRSTFEKLELSSAETMFKRESYPLDPEQRYRKHRYSL